jgi:8-oxo-dGTP pyrophosphatase MutT (NUDIX family)
MNQETFLNLFLFSNQIVENGLDNFNNIALNDLKDAAVLIPVVKRSKGLTIILTERALHLRHHPGQISFPGGKYETNDVNLMNTALRETQEEIGISGSQITVIGNLNPITTNSGFLITPFVAFIEEQHTIEIDTQEVRRILEVPVDYLLNSNNFYLQTLFANKQRRATYCIPYQNNLIWGATAQILKNLQKQLIS